MFEEFSKSQDTRTEERYKDERMENIINNHEIYYEILFFSFLHSPPKAKLFARINNENFFFPTKRNFELLLGKEEKNLI